MSDIRGLALLNPLMGGKNYSEKVIGYGPIAYWPLWEASGATAADQSGNGYDGTYYNVSLANVVGPDGKRDCPHFDGTDDLVDIYSAGLNGAFDGAEGTVSGWARVHQASDWAAGAEFCFYLHIFTGATSGVWVCTSASSFDFEYLAGGVSETIQHGTTTLAWFHWALTWSATADQVKAYFNGHQAGATATTLGTWAGVLDAAATVIGAASLVPGANEWHGWLAHIAVFDTPLTASVIADLADV